MIYVDNTIFAGPNVDQISREIARSKDSESANMKLSTSFNSVTKGKSDTSWEFKLQKKETEPSTDPNRAD
jgi:hypothetical protein